MNEITIYEHQQFGELRGLTIDDEPWFIAADICRELGLGNTAQALRRLDEDEKMTISLNDSHSGRRGGVQKISIVSEPGFYKLVNKSRKDDDPRVKAFQRWVAHDILPSIRKHGAYIAGQEEMTREELLAKAYLAAMEINKEKDAKIAVLQDENNTLQKINEENKPKVLFADSVSDSEDTISMGSLSKLMQENGLDIGRTRLFKLFEHEGYIMRDRGCPIPTQYAMERGWLKIKEGSIPLNNGNTKLTLTTIVTSKGQQYFINKYVGRQKEIDEFLNCWPEP